MTDYFVLKDHEDSRLSYIDISDKPSDFDKLIAFGLDPLIYRLRWVNENYAAVWEYWWGTEPFSIHREQVQRTTKFQTPSIGVTGGRVASPTPFKENRML